MLRWAFEDELPVLGICRGIQVLNVAAGGTLYQDIESQVSGAMQHRYEDVDYWKHRAHEITVEPDSRLCALLDSRKMSVNSYHHQAVKRVAPGFRVTAQASDGVIEGIERIDGHFVAGVQWHPEMLAADDPVQQALFDGFVDEARRWLASLDNGGRVEHAVS